MMGDPLVVGFSWFVVFLVGAFIGRRLAPIGFSLARVHNALNRLEARMETQTQRLFDEMKSVETKLDGYVAIINTSNVTIDKLLDMLKNSGAPPQELVDAAITGMETHLTSVGDALAQLASRQVPAATTNPQAAPAPVPNPVQAPTQEPAPVQAQGSAGPDTPQQA